MSDDMGASGSAFAEVTDPNDIVVTAAVRVTLGILQARIAAGDAVVVVAGDAGVGKTSVSRLLADQLAEDTLCVRVDDPLAFFEGVEGIVDREIAAGGGGSLAQLEAESSGTQHLLAVIDAAQSLSPSSLEKLAAFVDAGAVVSRQFLMLVRTPAPPALEAWLSDRGVSVVELSCLDRTGTKAYVDGRLAGDPDHPGLSSDALDELYHHSGGIPLAIERLAQGGLSEHAGRGASGPVEASDIRTAQSGDVGSVGDAIRARGASGAPVVGEAPGAATPAATGVFAQALARSAESPPVQLVPPLGSGPTTASSGTSEPSDTAPETTTVPEALLTTGSLLGARSGPRVASRPAKASPGFRPWALAAAVLLAGWVGFMAGMRVGEGRPRSAPSDVAAAPSGGLHRAATGAHGDSSASHRVESAETPAVKGADAAALVRISAPVSAEADVAHGSSPDVAATDVAVEPPPAASRRWTLSVADSRAALEPAFAALYAGDRVQVIEFFAEDGDAEQPIEVAQLARKQIAGRLHTVGVLAGQGTREEARILSIERTAAEDERIGYMPRAARAVRLGGDRPDPFEGTQFLYDDFRPRSLASYDVRRGRNSRLWREPVTVIDTTPRYRSDYDRVEFVVARSDHAIFETRFYRGGSKPVRISETPRRDIRRVDGHVVPVRLVARDLQAGTRAEARVTAFAIDSPLDDALFGLGRLRAAVLELPLP